MKNSLLFNKSDELAHLIYELTKRFSREELYGITSQLRRAALSVPLNLVEGYVRQGDKSYKQFMLISLGSLKEVEYLLDFLKKEGFISRDKLKKPMALAEETGKMLWVTLEKIKEAIK